MVIQTKREKTTDYSVLYLHTLYIHSVNNLSHKLIECETDDWLCGCYW